MEKDYYKILQVHPGAHEEVVKASYRTIQLKLGAHPDKGGSTEKAQALNEAYAVISDPQKRRIYDERQIRRPGTNLPVIPFNPGKVILLVLGLLLFGVLFYKLNRPEQPEVFVGEQGMTSPQHSGVSGHR